MLSVVPQVAWNQTCRAQFQPLITAEIMRLPAWHPSVKNTEEIYAETSVKSTTERSRTEAAISQGKQPPPRKERQMAPEADHGERSYTGNDRLKDKVAIITGADSGIGRAVAIAFAREGANLGAELSAQEEDDARETERWVKEAGRKAVLAPGDVSRKRYCEKLVQTATSKLGKLDILVNNAGFQQTCDDIADVPEKEFEHTFRTNVFGTFFLSQAAGRSLEGRLDYQHLLHPGL